MIFIFRQLTTGGLGLLLVYLILSINISVPIPMVAFGEISDYQAPREIVRHPTFFAAELAEATQKTNSIVFVGDVLLARNVEFLMAKHGSDYPYLGLNFKDIAIKPYVVGNFEATVPKRHVPTETFKINFSVAKEYLHSARESGFTHFSLANNHAYDFKQDDFINTKESLTEADLVNFGHPNYVSEDSVSFVDLKDRRVALVAIHALQEIPSADEIRSVLNYANQRSDLQIVYIHWGIEYDTKSSKTQQSLAKQLVAAGSDLIIGHHPHVVQDIGLIDGVPVFYSLGNFIFDQYDAKKTMEGLLLSVDFSDESVINLLPVTSEFSMSQPTYMKGEKHQQFLADLASRSDPKLKDFITKGSVPLDSSVATSVKIAMMSR